MLKPILADYLRLGYALLPLLPNAKRPHPQLVPNGLRQATTNPATLERWVTVAPTCNWGLLPPEQVLTLDVDEPARWPELLEHHPELAEAPRQRTPRGGYHVFLRLAGGVNGKLSATTRKLAGCDIRGLGRAYLAVAPSSVDGKPYVWERALTAPEALPEVPPGLLEKLLPPPPPAPAPAPRPAPAPVGDERLQKRLAGLLAWACDEVASTPEGQRHNHLYDKAHWLGGLLHHGLDEHTALEPLAAAGMAAGLPPDEARATAKDGLEQGKLKPLPLPPDDRPPVAYGRLTPHPLGDVGDVGDAPTPASLDGLLDGLTAETWPERKDALLLALAGAEPVTRDLALKRVAKALGASVGALQRAIKDYLPTSSEATTSEQLVGLALAGAELWHDAEGTGWATLRLEQHAEHWPVRSKHFKLWLARLYYEEHGKPPNSQALQDALSALEGKAVFSDAEHPVQLRVAHQDGVLWLDLGTPDWRAVRVDASGWQVLEPEVRFRRSKATGALPLPEPGRVQDLLGILEAWDLGEAQTTLALAWLLGTLSPGPYPVLALSGEQGSGKSTLARLLQRLVDPGDVSSLPRETRDLFVAARHSHVLAFDNVSGLPAWLSDDLCKLSTGGTLRVRELYTDGDEVFFHALRPVILNGITDFVVRQDLVDRSILLHLPRLERYEAEAELWDRFNQHHPRALGALLSLASLALRELPRTRVPNLRMADFARWALAAESGYAAPGAFEAAFADMRADSVRVALESEPIYPYLPRLLEQGRVEASAAELLERLNGLRGDSKPPEGWPRTPHALGQSLKRLAPALRQVGILAEPLPRSSAKRGWLLDKVLKPNVTNVINVMTPIQDAKPAMTFPKPDDISNVIAPEQMSFEEARPGRNDDIDDISDVSKPPSIYERAQEGEDDGGIAWLD